MASVLRNTFANKAKIVVTKDIVKNMLIYLTTLETRSAWAQALNTNMLGTVKIIFTPSDYDTLFTIFGTTRANFETILSSIPSSVINKEYKVVSDSFNIFITWAAHSVAVSSNLTDKEKSIVIIQLFTMMLYKFFSSLCGHYFPYKADINVMQLVVNNLTNKFDIVTLGTWKRVLEAQATEIITDGTIHFSTIQKYHDDKEILYVISAYQTRLRNKLKIIMNMYYQMKELDKKYKYTSSTMEIDGEKILREINNSFTTLIENVYSAALVESTFITKDGLRLTSELFKSIRPDMLKRCLVKFCDTALLQNNEQKQDTVIYDRKEKLDIYVGIHKLIAEHIQKTFRYCILNKVPLDNKLKLLFKVQDVYSASRLQDPDLLKIKKSFEHFVLTTGLSVRPATISSLTLALISYVTLRTLELL